MGPRRVTQAARSGELPVRARPDRLHVHGRGGVRRAWNVFFGRGPTQRPDSFGREHPGGDMPTRTTAFLPHILRTHVAITGGPPHTARISQPAEQLHLAAYLVDWTCGRAAATPKSRTSDGRPSGQLGVRRSAGHDCRPEPPARRNEVERARHADAIARGPFSPNATSDVPGEAVIDCG